MKVIPSELNTTGNDDDGFSFFPSQRLGSRGEGRDPHALLKADPLARQFPTERQIGVFLFLASLVLYLASMSWAPSPGLPTRTLLMHLGLEVSPGVLDSLWGGLVRLFARLPGLSVAGWTGLFGALCGAASVSLAGRLMVRVGYLIRNEPGPTSFIREAQARRLSGLVAGLYLACCIPFWVVSTRSLPGSFHVLLLLAAAWFFSQYQHWGKLRHLGLLGLLYGIGITEFATFILYLPLGVFLVSREMFRWRALLAWRSQLMIWGGLALGLSLYPLNAQNLFLRGAATGLFTSPWHAWGRILQDQALLITQVRYSPGFPVIMFFSLVPWLTLFAMSRRSPWFYEGGQVAVRLIFVGGLLGVLYNATFAPWKMLGLGYLMVTPYLLLAVCMGYMAGEFWILGESQTLGDQSFARRITRRARRVSSVFALGLPIAVLAGGAYNWQVVDGRHGGVVEAAAIEVLDRLDGRDILFSTGLLDDSLRLAVWERKTPVQLISAPRTSSPLYLRQLAKSFPEDNLKQPLLQGDFGAFLDNLLVSDQGPYRTCIIDMPDVFREFGYLVPDGFLYRLETAANRVNLPALIESQRPFWARMEQMALHPTPEENLVRPYQDMLRLLASKVANNLGVMQADRGDEVGAMETFRTARRIYPENLSVLLNLMELGRNHELPEASELDAEWDARREKLRGDRWALGIRFGYVWHPREWVRRGWVWVLSGAPATVEAVRRSPPKTEDEADKRAQFLDQAYLQWGLPPRDDTTYLALLMADEKDTSALLGMCRLALRRNDPEAAEAYITEALAMGLPEEGVLFDRAMAAYVRGEKDKALELLDNLTRLTPGDARVWMALVLLSDEKDPMNEPAMKFLKNERLAGIGVRLALAWVHLSHQQWAEAQTELEKAVQIDSRNTQAWEMMVTLSQERGNKKLMEASLRALLAREPDNYMQYQSEGVAHYKKGELAEAEASFRKGILRRRDPTLLNNLAQVTMERGGDLQEALDLVDESLRRNPGYAGFLGTRGAIYLKQGRFQEARVDLEEALRKQGRNNNLLLLLAQSYDGLGDRTRAMAVAKALARQPDKLDADQKRRVKELLLRLR
jgi:tetratricopeptide (TPR) repeat protein